MEIEELIFYIKEKENLRSISDKFLKKFIYNELNKKKYLYKIIYQSKDFKQLKKDPEFLLFFKEIRAKLNELYGLFMPKEEKNMDKILYSDISIEEKIIELLSITKPTKERLNFYKEIYNNIFLTDEISEILDLASGLNPISIYFSDKKPKEYYYVDISEKVLEINDYILKQLNINHKGYDIDLNDDNDIIYRHYQYIFLWKTIPILEKIDFYLPRKLFSNLDFDYLVVSIPTKSIRKGKDINKGWISWIKKFSYKIGYKIIKEFYIPNEYFAIIKK